MRWPAIGSLKRQAIAVCTFATGLVVIACAPDRDSDEQPPAVPQAGSWLSGSTDERLAQIERHLRGLDVAMAEIGYRYGELVAAAAQRQWNYAKYHTQKIDLALRLAVERRPARETSARSFLDDALPTVLAAIDSADAVNLDSAMVGLRTACITCHAAERVPHFNEVVDRIWERSR